MTPEGFARWRRGACAGLLAAAFGAPAAGAIEIHPEASIRGWFFSIEGNVEDTDLDALDFDEPQGQPEFQGGVRLGDRHHTEISYLRLRRGERGTASAQILGIVVTENDVTIDLDVDYLRGHYGYSLLAHDWIDLQPFIEIAWLREETDIRNLDTGQRERQEDSAVFPLPGLEIVLAPNLPVSLRSRVTGVATGQGHLIDVEGGLEGRYRFLFAGVGYRYVDFVVDDDDVNVDLDGVFVEGGFRF